MTKLCNLVFQISSGRMVSRALYVIGFLLLFSSAKAQTDCLLLNETIFSAKGIESELKNTFDENGVKLEEWRLISDISGGNYTTKRVFEYNEKGYLSKVTELLNGDFKKATSYLYDAFGNIISQNESFQEDGSIVNNRLLNSLNGYEKLFFDNNQTLSGKEVYVKNEEGKVTKFEIQNGNGKVNHSKEYVYNDAGNLIFQKKNDVVGNMIEVTHSSYNSEFIEKDSTFLNGNLIAKTFYEYENGFLSKKTRIGRNGKLDYIIEFDNNNTGLNIEERFIYQGELLSRIEREYGENDKLVLEKRFNNNNELLRTKTWEYNCPN